MRPLRLLRLHPRLPPRRRTRPRALFPRCQPNASVAISYLMWRDRDAYERTFARVKASRGAANPNMGFTCQLLQWHKRRAAEAAPGEASTVCIASPRTPNTTRGTSSLHPSRRSPPTRRRERRLRRLDGGRKRVRVDRTRVRRRSAPPTRAHVRATTARVRWIGRYSRRGRGRRRGDERRFGDDDDGRVGTPEVLEALGLDPAAGVGPARPPRASRRTTRISRCTREENDRRWRRRAARRFPRRSGRAR